MRVRCDKNRPTPKRERVASGRVNFIREYTKLISKGESFENIARFFEALKIKPKILSEIVLQVRAMHKQ